MTVEARAVANNYGVMKINSRKKKFNYRILLQITHQKDKTKI